MKATLILTVAMLGGAFANADSVIGESFTYALSARGCDVMQIPNAAQSAVDAALEEAKKICENPNILAARILSVEPEACRSWIAGFRAKAEVEFNCVHQISQ